MISGCAKDHIAMKSPQPERDSLPIERSIKITDFTTRDWSEEAGTSKYWEKPCEITVPKPEHVNDNYAFCVIGHEIWHCLTGDFHHDIKTYCSE